MSISSRHSNKKSIKSVLGGQNLPGSQFVAKAPQSRGRASARPQSPGSQWDTHRHTSSSSDPQYTPLGEILQPDINFSIGILDPDGRPLFKAPSLFISSPAPLDGEIEHLMLRPSSSKPSNMEVVSIQPLGSYDSRKWYSVDDYLFAVGSMRLPLLSRDSQRATPKVNRSPETPTTPINLGPYDSTDRVGKHPDPTSHVGHALSDSDYGREAKNRSHMLRSLVPTPDTNNQSDTPGASPASAINQLDTIKAELQKLLRKDHEEEECHVKGIVGFSDILSRDEVLKEVSKALHDRASAKFTMAKSERLILQREADIILCMSSDVGSVSAAEQQINTLFTERDGTREAFAEGVAMLLEKASALVEVSQASMFKSDKAG